MSDLNSDVTPEKARALYRVVRAMHDGNCPRCGHLAPSNTFYNEGGLDVSMSLYDPNNKCRPACHQCPECYFTISESESIAALKAFQPYMQANLEVFEEWRKDR